MLEKKFLLCYKEVGGWPDEELKGLEKRPLSNLTKHRKKNEVGALQTSRHLNTFLNFLLISSTWISIDRKLEIRSKEGIVAQEIVKGNIIRND